MPEDGGEIGKDFAFLTQFHEGGFALEEGGKEGERVKGEKELKREDDRRLIFCRDTSTSPTHNSRFSINSFSHPPSTTPHSNPACLLCLSYLIGLRKLHDQGRQFLIPSWPSPCQATRLWWGTHSDCVCVRALKGMHLMKEEVERH
jgi:hypothetical protein